MCTVTYLPTGSESFLLTSNRDEAPGRSPSVLTYESTSGLLFPRDTQAGGTWICVSETGKMVCLLNGAFVKHERQPSYRRSRGLVVLDFFSIGDANVFVRDYDFIGIEPFTLVIYDGTGLYDFRWDGEQAILNALDPNQPYIWMSATLYPPEIQPVRQSWFEQWLAHHPSYTAADIYDFHRNAGTGDSWNDLVMNRNNVVCTVSISVVERQAHATGIRYYDLLHQTTSEEVIAHRV